jgi:hypothetical protein
MLKLTYTEQGLHLERVGVPLDHLIAQRVILAIRTGQRLHIEPGQASFLLASDAPALPQLYRMVRMEQTQIVTIVPVDDAFVEITVQGSWIAESVDAEAGVFVTALMDMTEVLLLRLWETTQNQVAVIG